MWIYKQFPTREKMVAWIKRNYGKVQVVEVFVNNAYAIEYRKLRRIY